MTFYAGIGSRKTPREVCRVMTNIARVMEANDYTLRSGGALMADQAFEKGVVMPGHKEIFLKGSATGQGFAIARDFHPNWMACDDNARALHARNTHIILGRYCNQPVERVICWTPDGKASGGTGQGLRIAEHRRIPIHNLYFENIWKYAKRLAELDPSCPVWEMPTVPWQRLPVVHPDA